MEIISQQELIAKMAAVADTPVSQVDLTQTQERIKVDMDTRKISGNMEFGIQFDHLAKSIVFEVTRYVGGVDLSKKSCAIHWENGTNGGTYPITEMDLSEDGRILMCWELSNEFTQNSGRIAFAIHFFSIVDGSFTYHNATQAAAGKLGTTLNASDHSQRKIPPSEIEVWIQQMDKLNREMQSYISRAEKAAERAEAAAGVAEGVAEVVDTLPIASSAYRGMFKIVETEGTDTLYICLKKEDVYVWFAFGESDMGGGSDEQPDTSGTTSLLGIALLGKMILGME